MSDPLPDHLCDFEVDDSGCWLWQKSRNRDGYGWASMNGKTYQAHRLIYRLAVGAVPQGMILDHLCRVRHCVNPDHLEPVTPAENLRRSPITQAGQTHCLRCGSDFAQVGVQRRCPRCMADYEVSRQARKREQSRERNRVFSLAQQVAGLTQAQYRAKYGNRLDVALSLIEEHA